MSADKVVDLSGKPLADNTLSSNDKLVSVCERLLQMAKSGEITWFAGCSISTDEHLMMALCLPPNADICRILGALDLMRDEFMRRAVG